MTEFTADTFARARCLGSTAHDGRGDGESRAHLVARHAAAVEVCQGCPCSTACAALHQSMPRTAQAFGVWSAVSHDLLAITDKETS